jgi:hypothetical protein
MPELPSPGRVKGTSSMHRILLMVAAAALFLGIGAPVALAADPSSQVRPFVLSVDHDTTVPVGDHVDTLIVVDGNARVGGSVDTLVVVDGTATLTGATAGTVVVVRGTADLQAGTTVTGDVRTIDGAVTRAAGSVVQGTVRSFDGDVPVFAAAVLSMFVVLFVGFALATLAAALLAAAFGARQVRGAGELISREPGTVLVTGLVGSVVLPILAILVTMTIVGAPIGLGALLVVLPFLAFLGWIIAAIWVGDWVVARLHGARESGRPYLAAVLGVIVLGVAGMVPFVSAIATLFGFGALLLAAWRTVRPSSPSLGTASTTWVAPAAG